jgi:hypothetical protein
MTSKPNGPVNIGIGLAGAIIGAVIALVGIGAAFGGYREKIDVNSTEIHNTNTRIDRVETQVNGKLERIESKVDAILQANANRK